MNILIIILAIYAFSYTIRNLSGPFNILGIIRNKLMSNKFLGVFFYELLSCPWCLGFHCGYIISIIAFNFTNYYNLIIWAFAGSTIVAGGDKLFNKYYN